MSQTSDDAEERLSNGDVKLGSSDLELVDEGSKLHLVGIRFQNLEIPRGATITSARIEFETDEADSEATSLTLRAQAADDAATFTSAGFDLSSRPTTAAAVSWSPAPWPTVSDRHLTPDLSPLVQEVVDRPGWASGNSMAFLVSGSGERTAESYDGESYNAPFLLVS